MLKGDEEQRNFYQARLEETEAWQEKRRMNLREITVGDRVDVRDTEYIWCVGRIVTLYRKAGQPSELLIHYLGWNKIYDEILEVHSPRVAPFGFYTSREDIPRYALSEADENYYSYVRYRRKVGGDGSPTPSEPEPSATRGGLRRSLGGDRAGVGEPREQRSRSQPPRTGRAASGAGALSQPDRPPHQNRRIL